MNPPHTLDTLRQIGNPAARAIACLDYIDRAKEASAAAVRLKDEAITELLDQGHTVGEITAAVPISASQVKLTRRLRAVRTG